jgi:ribosomal-protein-alanine N-acetyltransferase
MDFFDRFPAFPALFTERLSLRSLELSDAQDLLRLRSDARVMQYLDTEPCLTEADAADLLEYFRSLFWEKKGVVWAVADRENGQLIGHASYHRIVQEHARAEIGYALHPDFWGKGLAKETVLALVNFGFGQMGLHSIEANVNPDNRASIKLLERIGFRREGYFCESFQFHGQFLDSAIYSLLTGWVRY